jgi:hypothetical protein
LIRSNPNYSQIDSIYGVAEPTITGFPSYARTTKIVHTGGPLPTYTSDYKTITVTVTSPALKTPVVETVVVAAP